MRAPWLILLLLACDRPVRPCARWQLPRPVAVVDVAELDEVSGVAVSRRDPGILWLLEDSGGEAAVYAVDHGGRRRTKLIVDGVNNVDWEALATGPCGDETCLYIGDIGDNLAARDDTAILRVTEPVLDGAPELHVTAEALPVRYPDGAQDAEALVVTPDGTPVILTKRNDGTTRVLLHDGSETLQSVGTIDTSLNGDGLPTTVTSADLWPDGSHLFVRTYAGAWQFALPGHDVRRAVEATGAVVPIPPEIQGEAVAYDVRTGGYWSVGEGARPLLFHAACAE